MNPTTREHLNNARRAAMLSVQQQARRMPRSSFCPRVTGLVDRAWANLAAAQDAESGTRADRQRFEAVAELVHDAAASATRLCRYSESIVAPTNLRPQRRWL